MIEIDISSFIFDADFVSSVTVSWHGFFSFVAVLTAVLLVGRWAPLYKLDPDDVLSVAVWCIIGGVIGARVVHVIDQWDAIYTANPLRVFLHLAGWHRCMGVHPGRVHRRVRLFVYR